MKVYLGNSKLSFKSASNFYNKNEENVFLTYSSALSSFSKASHFTIALYPLPYLFFVNLCNKLSLNQDTYSITQRFFFVDGMPGHHVITIDLFFSKAEECKMFHRYLLAIGSTPAEGQSRNTNEGLPIKDMTTQSFLLFPPLNLWDFTCLYSSSCIFFMQKSSRLSFCSSLRPFMPANNYMCSQMDNQSQKGLNWGHTHTVVNISAIERFTQKPCSLTEPNFLGIAAVRMLKVVDFQLHLGQEG